MIANCPRTVVASTVRMRGSLIWDQPFGHLCSTTNPTGVAFGPVKSAAGGRRQSVNWFEGPVGTEHRPIPKGVVRRQRMGGLGDART